MNKKKVAVIFTGGTISMKVDERLAAAIPAMSNDEIMSMITNVDKIAKVEVVDFARLPGPHMSVEKMLELSNLTKELVARPDIEGVVITHGTDTLEETAFFLDLNIATDKPIVMVGSMRNGSELGYDGPSNLSAAICTAISKQSKGLGVLVVMNNEVNAASEVTKANAISLDTFKSLEFGPLGIVDSDEVIFYRTITKHQTIETDHVEANVHLLKAAAGMDSMLIDFLVEKKVSGIVIEAMGRGNLPPAMVPGVKRAIESGIAIVIVTRCPMGRVLGSYGYEGGGKEMRDYGAIFGGHLNGQKARIKLILALSANKDNKKIKEIFEKDYYNNLK